MYAVSVLALTAFSCLPVPEPIYLLEKLRRVIMSHNVIKELSSLIDTWLQLVTLDLSFNQITSLHVSYHLQVGEYTSTYLVNSTN